MFLDTLLFWVVAAGASLAGMCLWGCIAPLAKFFWITSSAAPTAVAEYCAESTSSPIIYSLDDRANAQRLKAERRKHRREVKKRRRTVSNPNEEVNFSDTAKNGAGQGITECNELKKDTNESKSHTTGVVDSKTLPAKLNDEAIVDKKVRREVAKPVKTPGHNAAASVEANLKTISTLALRPAPECKSTKKNNSLEITHNQPENQQPRQHSLSAPCNHLVRDQQSQELATVLTRSKPKTTHVTATDSSVCASSARHAMAAPVTFSLFSAGGFCATLVCHGCEGMNTSELALPPQSSHPWRTQYRDYSLFDDESPRLFKSACVV